jgi:DNA-binding transcriptional MerR regulator
MSIRQKEETGRLYYSIGQVSEMFDLNPSTLRFWEKEFEFLKPTKNKKGKRLFTQKDIDHIGKIVELVKEKGFTIQGARDQLKKNSSPVQGNKHNEVIQKLNSIRDGLIHLRDNI